MPTSIAVTASAAPSRGGLRHDHQGAKGNDGSRVSVGHSRTMTNNCRVYWGSHGCKLERGHDGDCVCVCAAREDWQGDGNVGASPYYGPDARFYGEDAARRGLPPVQSA